MDLMDIYTPGTIGTPPNMVFFKKFLHWLPISEFRVVYGGKHTILLHKQSGKRVCKVTKEPNESYSLRRAVLYLVLKFNGIGGKEIEEWSSRFINYANLRMRAEFENAFLKWLLEFGFQESYDLDQIDDILKRIYYRGAGCSCFDGFLYFLCWDMFGIAEEQIDELISSAVCSEKPKTMKLEGKQDTLLNTLQTHSFDYDVNKVETKEEPLDGLEFLNRLKKIFEILSRVNTELKEMAKNDE